MRVRDPQGRKWRLERRWTSHAVDDWDPAKDFELQIMIAVYFPGVVLGVFRHQIHIEGPDGQFGIIEIRGLRRGNRVRRRYVRRIAAGDGPAVIAELRELEEERLAAKAAIERRATGNGNGDD